MIPSSPGLLEFVVERRRVSPSTQPASLGSCLEQHGWVHDNAPGMALDKQALDEPPAGPSQLTITRVRDTEHLNSWLRVMVIVSAIPEDGLQRIGSLAQILSST